MQASWPRERHYWGYIWDGTGNRKTEPIRNELNKSHMPACQYPLDYYPPFASGCGFALSWDLVLALTKQELPDYRLLVGARLPEAFSGLFVPRAGPRPPGSLASQAGSDPITRVRTVRFAFLCLPGSSLRDPPVWACLGRPPRAQRAGGPGA